ncbi:hypothetical protein B0H10DRAFT_2222129 [Mycena sp. CBHHK59/15]|nr:hypothetical protein B0H10DRAFT_2222129 [Mycena sp. CBHHK59/15]
MVLYTSSPAAASASTSLPFSSWLSILMAILYVSILTSYGLLFPQSLPSCRLSPLPPAPHPARTRPAHALTVMVPRHTGGAVRRAPHGAGGEGRGDVVWPERGGGGVENTPESKAGVRAGRDDFGQAYSAAEMRTFHWERVRKMPLRGLDSSLLLGFVVRDEAEWVDSRRCVAYFLSYSALVSSLIHSYLRASPIPRRRRLSVDEQRGQRGDGHRGGFRGAFKPLPSARVVLSGGAAGKDKDREMSVGDAYAGLEGDELVDVGGEVEIEETAPAPKTRSKGKRKSKSKEPLPVPSVSSCVGGGRCGAGRVCADVDAGAREGKEQDVTVSPRAGAGA